jgi:hypothetical protein
MGCLLKRTKRRASKYSLKQFDKNNFREYTKLGMYKMLFLVCTF